VSEIEKLKQDLTFVASPRGYELTFHSTWGLFSPRKIDEGSGLLVKHIDVRPGDVTIDLGCGYGAIGIVVAKLCPAGQVHMVDKDYVAVRYAKKNAEINGLANCRVYLSNAFSEVPADVRFDNVVANLPAKTGKEMLSIILHDSYRRLKAAGRLYVVTVTGLRKFIRRNLEEVFGNYRKLKQGRHYTAVMAERTGPGAGE